MFFSPFVRLMELLDKDNPLIIGISLSIDGDKFPEIVNEKSSISWIPNASLASVLHEWVVLPLLVDVVALKYFLLSALSEIEKWLSTYFPAFVNAEGATRPTYEPSKIEPPLINEFHSLIFTYVVEFCSQSKSPFSFKRRNENEAPLRPDVSVASNVNKISFCSAVLSILIMYDLA